MRLDADALALFYLALSDGLEVGIGLVQELGDVASLREDLGVRILIHEVNQVHKDSFDVADLVREDLEVLLHHKQPLFLLFELAFKCNNT